MLFLQSLQTSAGTGATLLGARRRPRRHARCRRRCFAMQRKLPYKRMLIVTGALIGLVLAVMVGTTVHNSRASAGCPPTAPASRCRSGGTLVRRLPDLAGPRRAGRRARVRVRVVRARARAADEAPAASRAARGGLRRPSRRPSRAARRARRPPAASALRSFGRELAVQRVAERRRALVRRERPARRRRSARRASSRARRRLRSTSAGRSSIEAVVRARDVGLEVGEVGVRVAILLARDLRVRPPRSAARPRRSRAARAGSVSVCTFVSSVVTSLQQLRRVRLRCRRSCSCTQRICSMRWKPVQLLTFGDVVDARVDLGIEVAEALGDRLDAS